MDIREVLRLWVAGQGYRRIAALGQVDRKTARRYIDAAVGLGLERGGGDGQLSDAFIGQVAHMLRPGRPHDPGAMRTLCRAHQERIQSWVAQDIAVPKMVVLLHRHIGVVVPERTLRRFVAEDLAQGRKQRTSVRVLDGEPGHELQVDFCDLAWVIDPDTGKKRKLQAMVFTPVCSRYTFVWPCWDQRIETVIEAFEAAWSFYGGVFRVVIPDNCKSIVTTADPLKPLLCKTLVEYAQARGFHVDPARVRRPQDKPRVERAVQYVEGNFWAGETFLGMTAARALAVAWCRQDAGLRIHGTTRQRPAEDFAAHEKPRLLPAPEALYDVPEHHDAKVGADHMIEAGKALYSLPTALIGKQVHVRLDRATVKVFVGAELVKVHPRVAPGKAQVDAADLPEGKAELALRDTQSLLRQAKVHGEVVAEYARQLLDSPLPWTRVRHVYRLLGLCKTHGGKAVSAACQRALEVDVVDVTRIARIVEKGLENRMPDRPPPPPAQVIPLRFARAPEEFAILRGAADADP